MKKKINNITLMKINIIKKKNIIKIQIKILIKIMIKKKIKDKDIKKKIEIINILIIMKEINIEKYFYSYNLIKLI